MTRFQQEEKRVSLLQDTNKKRRKVLLGKKPVLQRAKCWYMTASIYTVEPNLSNAAPVLSEIYLLSLQIDKRK